MSEELTVFKGLPNLGKLDQLVETGALDNLKPLVGQSILIDADGLPMRHKGTSFGYAIPGTPEHGNGREVFRGELARIKELLPLYDTEQLRFLEFLAHAVTNLVALQAAGIPAYDPSEIVDVDDLDAAWDREHSTTQ